MDPDLICPPYYGEDRIDLGVEPGQSFLAGQPVRLSLGYSRCAPGGAALPVVVVVQPVSDDGYGYERREYRDRLPGSFSFTPPRAGDYLVLARESAHNRWQGRLIVRVAGEPSGKLGSGDEP